MEVIFAGLEFFFQKTVVLVGGLGSMRGRLVASFALGMVMAVTGRVWGPASEAMVFAVMAVVLVFKPIEV